MVVRSIADRVPHTQDLRQDLRNSAAPFGDGLLRDKDDVIRAQLEPRGQREIRGVTGIQMPRGNGPQLARVRGGAQHIDLRYIAGRRRHTTRIIQGICQTCLTLVRQGKARLRSNLTREIDIVAIISTKL